VVTVTVGVPGVPGTVAVTVGAVTVGVETVGVGTVGVLTVGVETVGAGVGVETVGAATGGLGAVVTLGVLTCGTVTPGAVAVGEEGRDVGVVWTDAAPETPLLVAAGSPLEPDAGSGVPAGTAAEGSGPPGFGFSPLGVELELEAGWPCGVDGVGRALEPEAATTTAGVTAGTWCLAGGTTAACSLSPTGVPTTTTAPATATTAAVALTAVAPPRAP
jgi:hypothetical protein